MNSQIGSIWRKWDFHIHTPESKLNQSFGDNWDNYIFELFTRAIKNEISAIGITDYFIIDGYAKVLEYQRDTIKLRQIFSVEIEKDPDYLEKVQSVYILPNIEFRIDTVVSYENGSNKKLQVHAIFSNEIEPDLIKSEFLNRLQIFYEGTTSGIQTLSLNRNNLVTIGRKIKEDQKDSFAHFDDFTAGLNAAAVKFDELVELLNKPIFKNKSFLILAEDDITKINFNGQASAIRKKIYCSCHGLFSSNQKTIDWGQKMETQKEFSSFKPCLWGSDAHDFDKMFLPEMNRFCWMKADLSFEGLRQVFISPFDRVHIGVYVPNLEKFNQRRSFTIKEICVHKNAVAINAMNWFDADIFLNPGQVTIIGNKGSGKSAISDIISYVGNSHRMNDCSFLTDERFLKKTTRYGDDYSANIVWFDNTTSVRDNLSSGFDKNDVELVQFLPQRFIEKVCNDIEGEFLNEIKSVIYSYIEQKDRADTNSLDELIERKTSILVNRNQEKRNELENVNILIKRLEDKKTTEYLTQTKANLSFQNKKLTSHLELKPKVVNIPDNEELTKSSEIVSKVNMYIERFEKEIEETNNKILEVNRKLDLCKTFEIERDQIVKYASLVNENYVSLCDQLGIIRDTYVKVSFHDSKLNEKTSSLEKEKILLSLLVDDSAQVQGLINQESVEDLTFDEIIKRIEKLSSLYDKKKILEVYKAKINEKNSVQAQAYYNYLDQLKEWDKKKKQIIGEIPNNEEEGSIKKYSDEIKYIESDLNAELLHCYENRLKITSEIFDIISNKIEILEAIYKPIEEKLKQILLNIDEQIAFSVDVLPSPNLKRDLLQYINQRVNGPFGGTVSGNSYVENLINQTDFNSKESAISFVKSIYKSSLSDYDKVKSLLGDNRMKFNDYVGSLDYLDVTYIMKQDNKTIQELSPGERGILLLIFYLSLNRKNCPLIIDQPEDNLDNQSVYKKLVPCIIEAKKNRQVIIVTHNPNLAIACDSEQIIYCDHNKTTNEIQYSSGSIENPRIKEKIIDILEGTRPAFDLRKFKYE